jgi:hypothetical protein
MRLACLRLDAHDKPFSVASVTIRPGKPGGIRTKPGRNRNRHTRKFEIKQKRDKLNTPVKTWTPSRMTPFPHPRHSHGPHSHET